MEDSQALRIVSALANGAHPVTGEIFPPDSPYQAPEVIRALFVAARALESSAKPVPVQAPKSQPRNPTVGNAGKTWSADEDRQLLAAFDAGKTLADLAQLHGRTQGGIRARLEKHGRIDPSPATRWPVAGPQRSKVNPNGSRSEAGRDTA